MDNFRSDAERMAAIEETKKLMKSFEHVDVGQLVSESIEKFWKVRFAVIPFQHSLLKKAHANDRWGVRRTLFKQCRRSEKTFREHVAQCQRCLPLFTEGAWQMNEFLTKKLVGGDSE